MSTCQLDARRYLDLFGRYLDATWTLYLNIRQWLNGGFAVVLPSLPFSLSMFLDLCAILNGQILHLYLSTTPIIRPVLLC